MIQVKMLNFNFLFLITNNIINHIMETNWAKFCLLYHYFGWQS